MPVQMRYKSAPPNKTVTFDFGSDNVLSYVVGLSYWSYTFGSADHQVKTISLNVTSNQSDSHTITARINGTMVDDFGSSLDNQLSQVQIGCLAVVNSADSNLALAGAQAIPNGGSSVPIALPGSSLAISSAFLSGFNLSYGNSDHPIQNFSISAGLSPNGSQGEITCEALVSDSSGDDSTVATINGGILAATPNETGLYVKSRTNLQTASPVDIQFAEPVSNAVVFLQGIDMQFKESHAIQTIGGGTSGWKVNKNSVTLDNARAFMVDHVGTHQVDDQSSVSFIVVAIP